MAIEQGIREIDLREKVKKPEENKEENYIYSSLWHLRGKEDGKISIYKVIDKFSEIKKGISNLRNGLKIVEENSKEKEILNDLELATKIITAKNELEGKEYEAKVKRITEFPKELEKPKIYTLISPERMARDKKGIYCQIKNGNTDLLIHIHDRGYAAYVFYNGRYHGGNDEYEKIGDILRMLDTKRD